VADSSADRNPLDKLAEEFVARFRAGERPSLTEYVGRAPELAEDIRDLFPALVEMEQLKPVTADQTGGYIPSVERGDPTQLGDFRILRRVGQGGMGVVYEAIQESLGRHVALKLLPAEALLDPKKLERFRREAKSAAKLHHTNIVPVFGTGEANGRHFYAMQFISGHPLDAVIDEVKRLKGKPGSDSTPVAQSERSVTVVAEALVTGTFAAAVVVTDSSPTRTHAGPPSGGSPSSSSSVTDTSAVSSPSFSGGGNSYWATVARVGVQVADALAYAHKQGIQHRDIKPANLLLDLQGVVWVTDFGLAKSNDADDLTHTGDVIGTLRYMAPERFDGTGDARADIYALGLTLYELLTLTPAFVASNRAKLVEQVLAASPSRPRSINPAIPRDLETIVLKAITRDPAARYQTAGELADDLRRFTEDRPIRARRASWREQGWRWCRRNPAVAGLLATVVLLLTVIAGSGLAWSVRLSAALEDTRTEEERKTQALRVAKEEEAKKDEALRVAGEESRQRKLAQLRSHISEAQARRFSGRPGQRFDTLAAVRAGVALARELNEKLATFDELRDLAVAALTLPDVRKLPTAVQPGGPPAVLDTETLERYAELDPSGALVVSRLADGTELTRLAVPKVSECKILRFTPDGSGLDFYDPTDGVVKQWAFAAGTAHALVRPGFPVYRAEFTADGRRAMLLGSRDANRGVYPIVVYDLPSWKPVADRPMRSNDPIEIMFGSVSLSPTGRYLAQIHGAYGEAAARTVEVHDLGEGGTVPVRFPLPYTGRRPTWHPDGETLFVGLVDSNEIYTFNVPAAKRVAIFDDQKGGDPILGIGGHGELLASYSGWTGGVVVWHPYTGRVQLRAPHLPTYFNKTAADGRLSNGDPHDPWVLEQSPVLRTFARNPGYGRVPPYCLPLFHPGGRLIGSGMTNGVALIDGRTGQDAAWVPVPQGMVFGFDSGGALLTKTTKGLFRWPIQPSPRNPAAITVGPPIPLPPTLPPVTMANNFAASRDGRVVVHPARSVVYVVHADGRPVVTLGPLNDCRTAVVSPDGQWVVTTTHTSLGSQGPHDSTIGVHVWDSASGKLVRRLADRIEFVAFSPDGSRLYGHSGGPVWRTDTWEKVADRPATGAPSFAFGAISPDGGLHAVPDQPGKVRLVRPADGVTLVTLELAEPLRMTRCDFSPDGTQFIASGLDRMAEFAWDLRALRRELKGLGLDWDASEFPPPADPGPPGPLTVTVVGVERLVAPPRPVSRTWNEIAFRLLANPFDSEGYFRWGLSAMDGGYVSSARFLFDLTLLLKPGRTDAMLYRAQANLRLRQYRPTVDDATEVLNQFPTRVAARRIRAAAYLQLGRNKDVVVDLSVILRDQPADVLALVDRATAYRAAGEAAKAAADFKRADELAHIAPLIAMNNLAWQFVTGPPDIRQPKRALELIATAVAAQPNNAVYLNTLGVCQYRNAMYKEAVGTLEKSLTAGKGEHDAFELFFQAMCHHELGDAQKAKDYFGRAVAWAEEQAKTLTPVHSMELKVFRAEAAKLLEGK